MSEHRIVRVADLMTGGVHTINGLATVAEAIDAMRRLHVSSLVVNRRDGNDELGLVTVTDIARESVAKNRAPERVNVYEVMSKPVLAVHSEMQARYAVRLLVRFDVSRTLVVDEAGNPLGLVTLRDLVLGNVTG